MRQAIEGACRDAGYEPPVICTPEELMSDEHDEIIEEIRRRREAHAASLGYDLERITKELQREEREADAPVVQRAPRKPQQRPKRSSA